MPRKPSPRDHRFGGDWTSAKLEVLGRYLVSYTTALKNQPFLTLYVDAFAGTGYRTLSEAASGETSQLILPDLATPEPQALLDGSARIALRTAPRFGRYVFIERDAERCRSLRELAADFPALADSIDVRQGDANEQLQLICHDDWRFQRAVLFLDPYGMQVEWRTLEMIAATRAIDLWLLFPLGIGVNRLVTRSGDIPEAWRRRLDVFLGTDVWHERFYRIEAAPNLFGELETHRVKEKVDVIGQFFVERLRGLFPGVVEEPGILRNSSASPLYLLCFAAANKTGAPIALRIANRLLKDLR